MGGALKDVGVIGDSRVISCHDGYQGSLPVNILIRNGSPVQ